ncbi:type III-A CRISPR-associated protein Csm2 [Weissella soli]|uniref:type III-A CRISPR-associated protein Csm2 n=1 Tax=Weissella soli TaxID=155866 RepID=UPI0021C1A9F6|nr:type III-A CRISPR-associated protein Csm2 [Weissella soli]MCT8395110.1 type III-A CRISPR-associated protein Csm2 [Weissella soli]
MAILTDETYVDKAEKVIKSLDRNNRNPDEFKLTTTQIRNLLSLTSNLYDESLGKQSLDGLTDKLAYLRVQFVYQAGREKTVKQLVENAEILGALKEINDVASLQRFSRYIEALVAYFKFEGGKD